LIPQTFFSHRSLKFDFTVNHSQITLPKTARLYIGRLCSHTARYIGFRIPP
jgi:hypothetical protein